MNAPRTLRGADGLTDRQREMLAVIASSIRTYGYPPTMRAIGAAMGIRSTNGVNDHLQALQRKGCLVRDDLTARGIRLTERGAVAAGVAADGDADSDPVALRVRAALDEADHGSEVDPESAGDMVAAWLRRSTPRQAARIVTIVRAAMGLRVATINGRAA